MTARLEIYSCHRFIQSDAFEAKTKFFDLGPASKGVAFVLNDYECGGQ